MREITIKHKQHYVFQAYLKAWSTDNKIWCLRNGSCFCTNTQNIAQERDFYRIKELNDDEIKFLKLLWSKQSQETKTILYHQLDIHQKPFIWKQIAVRMRDLMRTIYKDAVPEPINQKLNQTEKHADAAINDMIEDIYSEEEGRLTKYLDYLKNGNLSFYYEPFRLENSEFDNSKRDFLYLIVVQHFRTKAALKRWEKGGEQILKNDFFKTLGINSSNVRLNHVGYYIFWYANAQVADIMYERNAHLTLLCNNTDIPFETSDQPIINLAADYQNVKDEVDGLIFYYPISPSLAITVNDNNAVEKIDLDSKDVLNYNQKIRNASYECVFSKVKM